jgi:hypothetical protein
MPTDDIRPRTVVLGAAVDLMVVVAFVVIGRRNHEEGFALAGVWHTLWPFLAGLAVGWVVSRAWRRALHPWRVGVPVWAGTVAVGLLLRALSGQGVAPSFILVTTAFLAVSLIGWRLVVRLALTLRSSRTHSPRSARAAP